MILPISFYYDWRAGYSLITVAGVLACNPINSTICLYEEHKTNLKERVLIYLGDTTNHCKPHFGVVRFFLPTTLLSISVSSIVMLLNLAQIQFSEN